VVASVLLSLPISCVGQELTAPEIPMSASTLGETMPELPPLCDSIPMVETNNTPDLALRDRLTERCVQLAEEVR
jgi:hypothetical protein